MALIFNPMTGELEDTDNPVNPYDSSQQGPQADTHGVYTQAYANQSAANPGTPEAASYEGWRPPQPPVGGAGMVGGDAQRLGNPEPPPPPNPYDVGGGTGSPSTFDISPSWPQLSLPRFDPGPGFQAPPAFSYGDFSYDSFKAPTLEQARNEPGFAFSMEQGRKALENSAAAKGVLRTGGTLKDILGWGQAAGEQNYGNVYNREATTYGMNRGNAFGNWEANRNNAAQNYQQNYNVSRDVFDRTYGQTKDKYSFDTNAAVQEFAPKERAATATFNDMFQRWREQVASLTNIAVAGAGH